MKSAKKCLEFSIFTNFHLQSLISESWERNGTESFIFEVLKELKSDEDIKKMNKLLDLLDEEDDVQNVYHNWDE